MGGLVTHFSIVSRPIIIFKCNIKITFSKISFTNLFCNVVGLSKEERKLTEKSKTSFVEPLIQGKNDFDLRNIRIVHS